MLRSFSKLRNPPPSILRTIVLLVAVLVVVLAIWWNQCGLTLAQQNLFLKTQIESSTEVVVRLSNQKVKMLDSSLPLEMTIASQSFRDEFQASMSLVSPCRPINVYWNTFPQLTTFSSRSYIEFEIRGKKRMVIRLEAIKDSEGKISVSMDGLPNTCFGRCNGMSSRLIHELFEAAKKQNVR